MTRFHENRTARTARYIAARLDSEAQVRLTVPSSYADGVIWRIMCYLNRFCGQYWIEYNDNYAFIRKQG
jgi:hypothetical protein